LKITNRQFLVAKGGSPNDSIKTQKASRWKKMSTKRNTVQGKKTLHFSLTTENTK